jgi:alpha-beta hydrolase superfamily lysophospholipase
LECLYRDLDSAARRLCEQHLPAIVDRRAYGALRTAASLAWSDFSRVLPVDALREIPMHAPVLLLAGEADRHAPVEEQAELLAALGGRADLVVIPGAEHDRLHSASSQRYRGAVLAWLEQCSQSASAAT